jgi:hypothetical protein
VLPAPSEQFFYDFIRSMVYFIFPVFSRGRVFHNKVLHIANILLIFKKQEHSGTQQHTQQRIVILCCVNTSSDAHSFGKKQMMNIFNEYESWEYS